MPAATKKTSFRLTDGQLVILNGAAQRPDRRVLPPLDSLTIKGAALTRTLAGLLKRGLVAEEHAAAEDPLWRSTDAGERLTLVLTDAGLRALGIEDAADEPGDAERAAAEAAVPVLNERVDAAPNETAAEAPEKADERPAAQTPFRPGTKGAAVADLLARPDGASLAEMMAATGWQAHSVRGFLSGALGRKHGLPVTSATKDGVRRYRIERTEG